MRAVTRLADPDLADRLLSRLTRLYGLARAGDETRALLELVEGWRPALARARRPLDQRDSVLITYADTIRTPAEPPLVTLRRFLDARVRGAVSTVHLLPFFPWSSDDGFSVRDHRRVDPAVGTWADVEALAGRFDLAFDLVLNHASADGDWFRQFVADEAPGRDYFVTADPADDLSAVVRPRTHPLLTPVTTARGVRHAWTTFSPDQVDLDFGNPAVLREFVDIVLGYVGHGARVLRLDAVAFLCKRVGSRCIHLEQTHEVVKLLRDVVDEVAPGTVLLTETNVPHAENVAYFGRGDEAQMVYQFSLPPLLLLALTQGDARPLTRWAADLAPPPPDCTWLNFTASHDGIGLRPLEGLVPAVAVDALVEHTRRAGGQVSMRCGAGGADVPYELNVSWFDAVGDGADTSTEQHVRRFLVSQTLPLSLQGVPALYVHSLLATRNWREGVAATGRARTINRRAWDHDELVARLDRPGSTPGWVFDELVRRLRVRASEPCFHPDVGQQVLDLGPTVFAVLRPGPDADLLCLHNLGPAPVEVDPARAAGSPGGARVWQDILEDGASRHERGCTLPGHGAAWLRRPR